MYIITSGMNPNEEHLEHYGRKGMRWGQHIFGMAMMGPYYSVYRKEMDNQAKKRGYNSYDDWAAAEKKQRQQNKLNKQFSTMEKHRLNRNKSEKSYNKYSDEWSRANSVASKITSNQILKNTDADKNRDKKIHKAIKLEDAILNETVKVGRDYIVNHEKSSGLFKDTYTDTIIANPDSKKMKQYADIINDSEYGSYKYTMTKGKKFIESL